MPDKKRFNFSKLGIYAILIIMAVVIVFPIYWMLLTTFQPTSQATAYPPALFFQSFSFDKLQEVLVQTNVLKWIVNSFIVAFGVVVVNLLVSVPAAYSMARYKIRFNKILLFAVLITQMIPPAIMVVPLFEIFASVGLNNKLLSLILADSILTLP